MKRILFFLAIFFLTPFFLKSQIIVSDDTVTCGTYIDTLQAVGAVQDSLNGDDDYSAVIQIGFPFTFYGNTYTSSGIYTWIGTNAAGCDTVATIDLTITSLNSDVVVVNDTTLQVQSVTPGSSFQWVDCNDNFTPIAGENNATFTTQTSG